MHRWCKFGVNVSNTLQDIMLTMFRDARTDEQDKTTMPPATKIMSATVSCSYQVLLIIRHIVRRYFIMQQQVWFRASVISYHNHNNHEHCGPQKWTKNNTTLQRLTVSQWLWLVFHIRVKTDITNLLDTIHMIHSPSQSTHVSRSQSYGIQITKTIAPWIPLFSR